MKKRIPKKDLDGINDIYEKHTGLPQPQLDIDDTVKSPNDPDAPLEDAFDISAGDYNAFAVSVNPDLQSEEDAVSLEGEYNPFALTGNNDSEAEDNAIDIMSFKKGEEKFPLSSHAEQDSQKKHGEIGAGTRDKNPENKKRKLPAGIVAAIAIALTLIAFLAWTVFGVLYTNKYNKYIYEQYHQGVDVKFINPDFAFFITIADSTLPVVQSASPKYFTTLDGNLFPPGTLTTSDGMKITGSPKLLPLIDSSLIGEKVTIEANGSISEYEIYSVGAYNPKYTYDTPTVFIEDKSSESGYTAFFTKPIA